ncbi:MAG: hypothetical protein Q8P87_01090 [bacterium]|nr:hypothetical protein [bacterium]
MFRTLMFASRLMTAFRREKRIRARKGSVDDIAEQVKQVLQTADQKLILMVRG